MRREHAARATNVEDVDQRGEEGVAHRWGGRRRRRVLCREERRRSTASLASLASASLSCLLLAPVSQVHGFAPCPATSYASLSPSSRPSAIGPLLRPQSDSTRPRVASTWACGGSPRLKATWARENFGISSSSSNISGGSSSSSNSSRRRGASWRTGSRRACSEESSSERDQEEVSSSSGSGAKSNSSSSSSGSSSSLPRRMETLLSLLEAEPDARAKSELLVRMGDAFYNHCKDQGQGQGHGPGQGQGQDRSSAPSPPPLLFSSPSMAASAQRVPGCVSAVSIAVSVTYPIANSEPEPEAAPQTAPAHLPSATVTVEGTADARVTRGVVALVCTGLTGEDPESVLALDKQQVAERLGLRAMLTEGRINGLRNIIDSVQKQVKQQYGKQQQVSVKQQQVKQVAVSQALSLQEQVKRALSSSSPSGTDGSSVAGGGDAMAPVLSIRPPEEGGEGEARAVLEAATRPRDEGGRSSLTTNSSSSGSSSSGSSSSSRSTASSSRSGEIRGSEEVAVLLSGGVDSSVALHLLLQQGLKPRAFYLKIWLEDELSYLGTCPWEEDLRYAEAVCAQAGVPLEVLSMQREYWDQVVSYTIAEARAGRTPNPDIMCNSRIKFGMFYELVGRYYEKVATGHYAQVVHREGQPSHLLRSPDLIKDQSYFLCALSQEQLGKALFPVGGYTKDEIRQLARDFDLPTQSRKDSQGICFLGKLKFDDFLRHYLGETPGPCVEYGTGEVIGTHRGLWFHTVGQRKGIGPVLEPRVIHRGPWYVAAKDQSTNTLVVTNDYAAVDAPREAFFLQGVRWIGEHGLKQQQEEEGQQLVVQQEGESGSSSSSSSSALAMIGDGGDGSGWNGMIFDVKTRHGPSIQRCSLLMTGPARGLVRLLERKDSGLAAGQYAALYEVSGQGEKSMKSMKSTMRCVGSGVIEVLPLGLSVEEALREAKTQAQQAQQLVIQPQEEAQVPEAQQLVIQQEEPHVQGQAELSSVDGSR